MKNHNQVFRILKTGNLYFPVNQSGKKFIVNNTYDIEIKNKTLVLIMGESLKSGIVDLSFLARETWLECKRQKLDKKCKNGWISVQRATLMKDKLFVTIDLLISTKR